MSTQQEIERARDAAAGGDLSSAQKILKEIITKEPQNVDAWLALADVMQKPNNVEKCLQRVLKIDPGNQTARQKLATLENSLTRPEKTRGTKGVPAQRLDNRLQQVTQPSAKDNDPWQGISGDPSPPRTNIQEVSKPRTKKQPQEKHPEKSKKSVHWLEALLVVILVMSAICVVVLFFVIPRNSSVQGGLAAGETSPTNEDITAVIYENIRAANAKNLSRYMATIHSKSPSYESTRALTKQSFSLFDLSYKVSGVRVVKQNKNEVVVAFILTTKKIRGPSFRDNKIDGEMILKKEGDYWKIYDQDVHNVIYLN